jgi:hypothetical protein
MCCILSILVFLGPRLANIAWWLIDSERWSVSFGSAIWPILGIIFLPWTTLVYAAVNNPVEGISLLGWIFLVIGVIADISSNGGGGYYNRKRVPGYNA